MDTNKIIEGIIIGTTGGISISLINKLFDWIYFKYESCKVYKWLLSHTKQKISDYEYSKTIKCDIPFVPTLNLWTSTTLIAVHNNLTQDRIVYICSKNKKIIRNEKENEVWTIKSIKEELKSKKN